jgi:hypothetical protein
MHGETVKLRFLTLLEHYAALSDSGSWGSVVVKALHYKSEGPGIDSRCRRGFFGGIWQFHMPLGRLSQVNPGGKGGRCVRPTTYHIHVLMSRNLGAWTSWNSVGLFRPVMVQLYLFCLTVSYRPFGRSYRSQLQESGSPRLLSINQKWV